MSWTLKLFIKKFFQRDLGRKKTYGSYKVIEHEHCKFLVANGESLLAVDFSSPETPPLAFWVSPYSLRWRTRYNLNAEQWPRLSSNCISDKDADIANSGLVDYTKLNEQGIGEFLIEIGDKPFLYTPTALNDDGTYKGNGTIIEVPSRCSTVKEAKALIEPNSNRTLLCGSVFVEPMPPGWEPPKPDETLLKELAINVNPLAYGFEPAEIDTRHSQLYSFRGKHKSSNGKLPCLLPCGDSDDPRIVAWVDAVQKAQAAWKVVSDRYPVRVENLSASRSRYGGPPYGGMFVKDGLDTYAKGTFHSSEDWEATKQTLYAWHKIIGNVKVESTSW